MCLATPGAAKCLFETHPSRRHFPANGIDAPGSGRGSAESPAALTALTPLTALSIAGRRSPAGRKFEKLAHDRPIGPRIPLSSRNRGTASRIPSLVLMHRTHAGFWRDGMRKSPQNITCCWHGMNSPNAGYVNHGRHWEEEGDGSGSRPRASMPATAMALSHFY